MAETADRLAGSLIGAVLESTGYHYQQAVLEAFRAPFENEVGGLIYLVAIIMAVIYTSTQGGFKMSAWLLIGPPLFFSIIQVTRPINNARWEFGEQARPQEKAESAINKATGFGEKQATVSSAFARYVEVVSTTVRAIVDQISFGRENTDLWFMVRAQMFAMMHTTEIKDPGLLELFHRSLVIDCRDVVRNAELVNDPLFRAFDEGDAHTAAIARSVKEANEWFLPSKGKAEEDFASSFKTREVQLGPSAKHYVKQIFEQNNEEMPDVFNCADIWLLVLNGFKEESGEMLRRITKTAEQHGIPDSVINNLLLQANAVKRNNPIVFPENAGAGEEQAGAEGEGEGEEQAGGVISADDVEQIKRIMSLFLLRNEHTNPDKSAWISWMSGRHESRTLRSTLEGDNSITERSRISVREWAEKERLIHAASSLPYYQGLILLFLGALFPFFALLLLIPGKHTGFLLWFCLWFWAKSWDIGFAVVMLLDDLLFAMLAVEKQEAGTVQEIPEGLTEGDVSSIGAAFVALKELDPSFQLTTYYNLVSVALMAVPIVSAQLFLGTMAQGASLIEKGTRAFSDTFADSAHHHTLRDAMHAMRYEGSLALQRSAYLGMKEFRSRQSLNQRRKEAFDQGIDVAGSINHAINDPSPGADRPVQYFTRQNTAPTRQAGVEGQIAARDYASDAGQLSGLRTPNPLGGKGTRFQELLNAKSYYSGAETAKAEAEGLIKVINAEMNFEQARQEWFTVHEEIRKLHVRAAPLGILPLPPSGSTFYTEPSQEEYQMTIANYRRDTQRQIALVRTYKEMSASLLEVLESSASGIGVRFKDWTGWNNLSKKEQRRILNKVDWAKRGLGVAARVPAALTTQSDQAPDMLTEATHNIASDVSTPAPPSGSPQELNQQLLEQWNAEISRHFETMELPQQEVMFYRRTMSPEENIPIKRNQFGFDLNLLPTQQLELGGDRAVFDAHAKSPAAKSKLTRSK